MWYKGAWGQIFLVTMEVLMTKRKALAEILSESHTVNSIIIIIYYYIYIYLYYRILYLFIE